MLAETWKIYTYQTVQSTMDHAAQMLGGEEQFAILAHNQTKGRGRQGRQWVSLEGNLYTTLAFKPPQPCHTWGQISFVAALAVGEVIQHYLSKSQNSQKVRYKWPNDLLIAGYKVSGILLEIIDSSWLLVGVGVNLQNSPTELQYPSTSLQELAGEAPLPEEALSLLTKHFNAKMNILEDKGFSEIRSLWLKAAASLGEEIEVTLRKQEMTEKIKGKFIHLDEEGRLLLELPNKEVKKISAGDVFLL
jgi:BirA family biotin operon repressor/biotin-[acetyl-CoA-carboxylase] ligase